MLRLSLDRNLPVAISAQLKGQIEYGIAAGALKPGEQLPSVRELAAAEGIAPVTVSHVYSALKREGLILVRPGMGTYVAGDGDGQRAGENLGPLQRLVDAMVGQALDRGFTAAQISHMVTARLAGPQARCPTIALVGLFGHATEVYARELARLLADLMPYVTPYTVERLRAGGEAERARVRAADLVLTLAHRVREVHTLLSPRHPPLRGLTFVVHPETIDRLRALSAGTRLGVISTFAEFLPTMLSGVTAHAPHAEPPLCAVLSDVERVGAVLARAEAVVYASGSEAVVAHISRAVPVIEYLHTPEPASVDAIRPLLARVSGRRATERRESRESKRASRVG